MKFIIYLKDTNFIFQVLLKSFVSLSLVFLFLYQNNNHKVIFLQE